MAADINIGKHHAHAILHLLVLNLLIACVHCCGITTHVVISQRARQDFNISSQNVDYRKLIEKHHDAFLGGSPYPDSFYSNFCLDGIYHDVSEDTHWSGFLNASINYIHKKYPQPWDEATEKLVVFLFGVVSHQVADILWHGLGVEQGFIDAMANVNFHGSFDKAHPIADFGGDIYSVFNLDVNHYMDFQKEWYVPVEDLYQIYRDMYGKERINATVIDSCSTILFFGGIAEILAGTEAYMPIAELSPFLIDQVLDYFVGGINDMAGWSNRLWRETVYMLEHGTSACDIPHNTLYLTCNDTYRERRYQKSDKKLRNGFFVKPNLLGLKRDDFIIEKAYRGITIKPGRQLMELLEQKHKNRIIQRKLALERKLMKKKHEDLIQGYPKREGIYYTPEPYSRLGWSLDTGDIDGDGYEDILAGSPGYGEPGSPQQGRVYILYGDENGLPTTPNAYDILNVDSLNYTSFIRGPQLMQSRFGSAVSVLDVNLDGILDIAIGAPAYSKNPLDYNGAVFIYFGRNHTREFQGKPNIIISCQTKYCNLGTTLAVADFDNDEHLDLIMGVPFYQHPYNQSGIVSGLSSSVSYKDGEQFMFEKLLQIWNLQSNQSFSWYGYNLNSRYGVLMVSQPYFRKCARDNCSYSEEDIQSIGKLHVYNLGKRYSINDLAMTGLTQYEMLGYSADIGFPYDNTSVILAVGVPGADVEGKDGKIDLKLRQAGVVKLYNITSEQTQEIAVFQGDRKFGRFGVFVKFTDLNGDGIDDLFIGAPRRNDDITDLIPRWFDSDYDGKLYTFYGGKAFPKGSVTTSTKCGKIFPCPEDVANFTADAYGYRVNLGWSAVVTKYKNVNNLVTSVLNGDEHYSSYSSDSLYVYRVNTTESKINRG